MKCTRVESLAMFDLSNGFPPDSIAAKQCMNAALEIERLAKAISEIQNSASYQAWVVKNLEWQGVKEKLREQRNYAVALETALKQIAAGDRNDSTKALAQLAYRQCVVLATEALHDAAAPMTTHSQELGAHGSDPLDIPLHGEQFK